MLGASRDAAGMNGMYNGGVCRCRRIMAKRLSCLDAPAAGAPVECFECLFFRVYWQSSVSSLFFVVVY